MGEEAVVWGRRPWYGGGGRGKGEGVGEDMFPLVWSAYPKLLQTTKVHGEL